jgi:uncharacterized protein (DUF302 family)
MPIENYGFERRPQGMRFDDAVLRIREALGAEGFGVLTEIDVQQTLKKKLDVDFRKYVILGACNPSLAHRALETEPGIGLLLPCNVVVQESGEGVSVSIADPLTMFRLVDSPALQEVAREAAVRLRRVLDSLAGEEDN